VLDPLADRVVLIVAGIAILVDGSVPPWIAIAVLVRETLVSGAVLALAAMGARRIDVQWVGKAGTFALFFALPFFLMSHAAVGWHATAGVVAWAAAIPGLVLSWYAAATYLP